MASEQHGRGGEHAEDGDRRPLGTRVKCSHRFFLFLQDGGWLPSPPRPAVRALRAGQGRYG
jgi:hypothetical protein